MSYCTLQYSKKKVVTTISPEVKENNITVIVILDFWLIPNRGSRKKQLRIVEIKTGYRLPIW